VIPIFYLVDRVRLHVFIASPFIPTLNLTIRHHFFCYYETANIRSNLFCKSINERKKQCIYNYIFISVLLHALAALLDMVVWEKKFVTSLHSSTTLAHTGLLAGRRQVGLVASCRCTIA